MKRKFLKFLFLLLIFYATFDGSQATVERTPPSSEIPIFLRSPNTGNTTALLLKINLQGGAHSAHTALKPTFPFFFAGVLSFMAAVISSAGGIGGGGLFIPILTIVAGLDLKTASSFSAFMVTGGSTANIASHLFSGIRKPGSKPLVNFDIALLSEPCMLLGVSCGVICNQVFPEWLITVIFANFLALSTFKTCRSGVLCWKSESEGSRRLNGRLEFGNGEDNGDGRSEKVPLLSEELNEARSRMPWMKLGKLVIIWFSFLLLYLIRGNRYGQGIIHVQACGRVYWIISSIQIPIAVAFTAWILYRRDGPSTPSASQDDGSEINPCSFHKLMFPMMTLLAGVLGGFFGIGGGMLVTAATCSFMVFFSSTMSAIQYLLLSMEDLHGALTYAIVCFVASIVGLTLVQRAIKKHGRASLIVFSVATVMALSTILITSFGAMDIWRDFSSGRSMGFKPPC
ncbi:sulfite exporter TauE/SafE family protein 5-like isoform X2 [Primulina huaijiensis]|uniref:sulfite exporter TauE/SafE family protein 5-like isoform X2 n=1 Tax=Primulina huaijiensis TaxID=1492673 RepID=UPI003CC764A0